LKEPNGDQVITDVEAQFRHLLQRAEDAPREIEKLHRQKTYYWDEFPGITVARLTTQARLEFRAGLRLASDSNLAHAADAHIRALLEYLAQVAWIVGISKEDGDSSIRCRAICFDLGTTKDFLALEEKAEPAGVPAGNIELLRERVVEYQGLHEDGHCTCRDRNRRGVRKTIEALVELGVVNRQTLDLWALLSTGAHLELPDRIMSEQADGYAAASPATYRERARTLKFLLYGYAPGEVWFLQMAGGRAEGVDEIIQAVEDDPLVARALAGELDADT
jgi:hypothetical protein